MAYSRFHQVSRQALKGHVRQLEGESPFDNLMEVIVSRRREIVMLYEK
jgi:hypothetical protein